MPHQKQTFFSCWARCMSIYIHWSATERIWRNVRQIYNIYSNACLTHWLQCEWKWLTLCSFESEATPINTENNASYRIEGFYSNPQKTTTNISNEIEFIFQVNFVWGWCCWPSTWIVHQLQEVFFLFVYFF